MLKSEFVNLKTRVLSEETSHEFIEWCGIVDGIDNPKLGINTRIYTNDLYLDFINEYPDYAPKAKLTVSRIKFSKWLLYYGNYKFDCNPLQGKDMISKWIKYIAKDD